MPSVTPRMSLEMLCGRGMLIGDIRADRQEKLLVLMEILKLIKVIDKEGHEGVLKVADDLKIAFYDAPYVYAAKALRLPLVIEDIAPMNNAKNAVQVLGVEAMGGQ